MRQQPSSGYIPFTIHNGLAIYRIGQGDPVLLMPGPHRFQLPGDGTASPLISGLVQNGRQVISYDPPGSGHSTRAMHLSMSEMHECADEALDQSGIFGRVDALGHGMGGLCLLAYAMERPFRIRRLVLIGTGAGGPAYMKAPGALWNGSHADFWKMALIGILQYVWPCQAMQTVMMNFIEYHSYVDKRWTTPQCVRLMDWFRRRERHPEWHSTACKLDYRDRLHEIRVPTLLLCGRHDPQFPTASTLELAGNIQDARTVLFDASGHYPFVEEADAFWKAVADFWQQTEERELSAKATQGR